MLAGTVPGNLLNGFFYLHLLKVLNHLHLNAPRFCVVSSLALSPGPDVHGNMSLLILNP